MKGWVWGVGSRAWSDGSAIISGLMKSVVALYTLRLTLCALRPTSKNALQINKTLTNTMRMKLIKKIILASIFLISLVCHVMAQREQLLVGTRPISMGEAFVAVADDGSAIHWNPAGLARMERIQASFAFSDLFGIGIKSYYANFLSRFYFIPPLTDYLSFGIDWLGIQNGDEELDYHQNQVNLALAFKPPKNLPIIKDLSLGLNAKYIEMGTVYGDIPVLDADGWGWDFGVLYHLEKTPFIPGSVSLGMMVHDVNGTRGSHDTGVKETILPQNIRWGFCYRPFEELRNKKIPLSDPVFAIDFDDRLHLGFELWLWNSLAFRAGIQKDFYTQEKISLSFGLGFKTNLKNLPRANFDYALTDSPVLPNTNKQFGGSFIIKENPRLIRIEGAHIHNVFASLYLHYGKLDASIGFIKLKNVSDDTLKAWISLKGARYMDCPKPDTIIIAPETSIDFPLRAIFNSGIFYAPEGRLTGEVDVVYQYNGNKFLSNTAVEFHSFSKNYLTWDDPGKAAAFVTYDDRRIHNFVDQALTIQPSPGKASWLSKYKLFDSLILFNALKAYGITYRLDPVTPFPSLADTLHGALYRLDKIQYPAELLSRDERYGDCDDIAVLYASLLQNAGLATALVSVPGHIFMMFDTGINQSRVLSLPIPPELFFQWKGNLWIPIETTMISTASFIQAWKTGTGLMNRARDQNSLEIIEVAENQQKYPPVSPELLQISNEFRPIIPNFASALNQDIDEIDDLKIQYLQALENRLSGQLTQAEKIEQLNHYGIVLGQNGEIKQAKVQFNEILNMDSAFVSAWNNLGNIEFMEGNFLEAESLYIHALHITQFSSGINLNLAILYQMMINSFPQDSIYYQQKSDTVIKRTVQLLEGKVENAFSILGLEYKGVGGKAYSLVEDFKIQLEWIKSFLDACFKQYQQQQDIKFKVIDFYDVKSKGITGVNRGVFLFWSD